MTTQTSQGNVLLVDDDPDLLDALSRVLKRAGYTCYCAQYEEAALKLAKEIDADLVISDINLAGTSGLVLCEKLKQELGLHELPVIFLSGAQISDAVKRAHAVGGMYYLRKPFDTDVLLDIVSKSMWMPSLMHSKYENN